MTETQGMPGTGQAGQMNIGNIEETMMNIVHTVASFFTYPVEIGLRPQYGTTYFSAPIMFISLIMMVLASTFFGIATAMTQMIPFVRIAGPSGMFGLGSFTSLIFLASIAHGLRLWRRMIHMELEENSTYEGPPLFFFLMLPKGSSFWFCRIVWEPVALFSVAILLSNLGIIQLPLMLYLQLAAIFLAMKQYISWYRTWLFIRRLMDMANVGPVIGRMVSNTATDEELARVHLASLPQNLSPDMRRATVAYIARAFSAPIPEEEEK
jgi:hypothetical protein